MQRDLVGTPRRCTVGIFDRFAVVQLYKRLSAVCIVGIFRAPSVTGERVCQLGRLHISAENALFNAKTFKFGSVPRSKRNDASVFKP